VYRPSLVKATGDGPPVKVSITATPSGTGSLPFDTEPLISPPSTTMQVVSGRADAPARDPTSLASPTAGRALITGNEWVTPAPMTSTPTPSVSTHSSLTRTRRPPKYHLSGTDLGPKVYPCTCTFIRDSSMRRSRTSRHRRPMMRQSSQPALAPITTIPGARQPTLIGCFWAAAHRYQPATAACPMDTTRLAVSTFCGNATP